MTAYVKGTTPAGEMAAMREAFARCTAAIYALPDAAEALAACDALQQLAGEFRGEAADFRAWTLAGLADHVGLSHAELAGFAGVSRPRMTQLIARAKQRGNPVTEPTTLPELPHLVLAIVTTGGEGGRVLVCVARRVDRVPPWTFPGGDMTPGESPGEAMTRRVRAETGLEVAGWRFLGRRIHELTSRVAVYGHAHVAGVPELANGDPEDLAEVRWVEVGETAGLMPTMYGPVRQLLDELARSSADWS